MAGSIMGEVLNQRDGQQVADAVLRLTPTGGEKTSAIGGAFIFDGLPAGNDYELKASKEGFEEGIYGPLVVMDGVPTKLVVALQPKEV